MLAAAPKSVTDKLQRVLNAAARFASGTQKYDRGLSDLRHTELHWRDVPERVQFKRKAPQYLHIRLGNR